jgi:hypothetical protein
VWAIAGGVITAGAGSNSVTVTWGAAGAGTLQLTETITATTCAVTTGLYNVTINPTPVPVISGAVSVCANQLAVVYSTPNVIGDFYSWTVVGGSIVSGVGTSSIVVDWGAAGPGSITVIQFIVSSGCAITTAPYPVTINPIPAPLISGNNAVCANDQNIVYSTALVAGHTYSWTATGGVIDGSSTNNSVVIDWGIAGPGTIQLTETVTASGCFITTPVYNVFINNIPTPVISGSAAVCANDTGVIYSTPNVPGNSYTWTVVGGSITAGVGTNSITVDWGGTGSGSVSLTEFIPASSCLTSTGPYVVAINPIPTPVVSGDNAVCENEQNKVYSSPLVAGNTYSWIATGGTIDGPSTGNSVIIDWGVAGTGTLQLTETIGTCSTTTAVYNVNISPVPTPVIAGLAIVCANQSGVIYTTPNVVGNSYAWTVFGGNITAGSGTNSITVTWISPGVVQLTETNILSGCS